MTDTPTLERVIQLFNIIRLYFKGSYDWVKYNGKSKSWPKMDMQKNAIARKLIQEFETEEEIIRHLALCFFYDKSTYLDTIAKPDAIARSKGILMFYGNVDSCVKEIDTSTLINDIVELDGYPAEILMALLGKRINPIVFTLLDHSTLMTNIWENALWERNKTKVRCMETLLALPKEFGVSFRKTLKDALNNDVGGK